MTARVRLLLASLAFVAAAAPALDPEARADAQEELAEMLAQAFRHHGYALPGSDEAADAAWAAMAPSTRDALGPLLFAGEIPADEKVAQRLMDDFGVLPLAPLHLGFAMNEPTGATLDPDAEADLELWLQGVADDLHFARGDLLVMGFASPTNEKLGGADEKWPAGTWHRDRVRRRVEVARTALFERDVPPGRILRVIRANPVAFAGSPTGWLPNPFHVTASTPWYPGPPARLIEHCRIKLAGIADACAQQATVVVYLPRRVVDLARARFDGAQQETTEGSLRARLAALKSEEAVLDEARRERVAVLAAERLSASGGDRTKAAEQLAHLERALADLREERWQVEADLEAALDARIDERKLAVVNLPADNVSGTRRHGAGREPAGLDEHGARTREATKGLGGGRDADPMLERLELATVEVCGGLVQRRSQLRLHVPAGVAAGSTVGFDTHELLGGSELWPDLPPARSGSWYGHFDVYGWDQVRELPLFVADQLSGHDHPLYVPEVPIVRRGASGYRVTVTVEEQVVERDLVAAPARAPGSAVLLSRLRELLDRRALRMYTSAGDPVFKGGHPALVLDIRRAAISIAPLDADREAPPSMVQVRRALEKLESTFEQEAVVVVDPLRLAKRDLSQGWQIVPGYVDQDETRDIDAVVELGRMRDIVALHEARDIAEAFAGSGTDSLLSSCVAALYPQTRPQVR